MEKNGIKVEIGWLPCGHPAACDGLAGQGGDQPGCGWCADIADNAMLIDHLSRTYDHFSGGIISKPNTLPEEVFRIAGDRESNAVDEAVREAMEAAPRPWYYVTEKLPEPNKPIGRFWVRFASGCSPSHCRGYWYAPHRVFVSTDGRAPQLFGIERGDSSVWAYAWEPEPEPPPLPGGPDA